MIHCHDDTKQVVILDQYLYLQNSYAGTKHWRRCTTTDESRRNLTWRKELFYVEQPFRMRNNEQKKKQPKRTHDEAFNEPENELIAKLNQAVNFCKSKLSSNADESLSQTEHKFDLIPFADIATQQCNNIPSIHRIPLTDYFLRASKLGLQTNILYTHNKDHPSIIDTAIAGEILLPANCRFLWSDIKNTTLLVNEGTKYSFIVLDPPWANKSVRRKRPYNWSDLNDIKTLPIEHLIDRTRSSLICCWCTNCDRIEEFIKNDLFTKWNCQYLTTWYWLKVTRSGESVLDLNSLDKKSYETLILAYSGNDDRFNSLKNTTKIICSIPALIHSTKPTLHVLFQNLIDFPKMEIDHCLEVYARNLLPNFTSIGNEIYILTMASTTVKKVPVQTIDSLDALLKTNNIFLFIPNIIGYLRVFLSIVSFYFMPTHPRITIFCYLTSEFLDALDGHAARALGQSTKFGAMFDMLVDRCSTMCLCFVLAMFYPKWALFFQLWAAIDVASHWLHLHAATVKGSESHKKIDLSGNPILRLYYTSRKVLFTMCAGNELWFSMVYMLHFSEGPAVITVAGYALGLWRFILYAVTPIMIAKQIISLIHLYTAALDMASIDEAERASKSKST